MLTSRMGKVWAGFVLASLLSAGLANGQDPAPAAPVAREAVKPVGTPYALMVDSNMTVTPTGGTPVTLRAWARFEYGLDRRPDSVEVSLDKLGLLVEQNGQGLQDSKVSREGFRARPRPGAEPIDIPYEKAPQALREMLDTFGKTAIRVTLDPANGKETARDTRVKGPLAPTITGLVDSVLTIHTPFPADQKTWEAPGKIALAQGQMASGPLTYEKVEPIEGTTVKVKVKGILRAAGALGNSRIKDGVYEVSGEQVYDTEKKAWRSARWNVAMDYAMTDAEDKPVAAAKGPLTLVVGAPADVSETAKPSQPNEAKTPAKP